MKIEILGTGCAKCKKLYELTEKVAADLGLDCQIEKVTNLADIMAYKVMSTPGLVIDGEVKMTGKMPSEAELKEILS